MTFPIVKIIDYRDNPELKEKLETSANPMAMVVKAQLNSYGIKRAAEDRRAVVKLELIRLCSKQGYSRERKEALLKFIDWLILLSDEFNEKIKDQLEEDKIMPYITSWERIAEKKGVNSEKVKTARMMLADGLAMDVIARYTGLTLDEIKKLTPIERSH